MFSDTRERDRYAVIGPTIGPQGGGVGVVAQSVADALSAVGCVRIIEHRSQAPRLARRAIYLRDWARANARLPSLNVYCHLDLARLQGALPSNVPAPYAVFLHGWEVWSPLRPVARRALERATFLLANSAFTVEQARRANPWLPNVVVVHLGLSEPLREPGPWPRPARVTIVGRLDAGERLKGHDLILSAWQQVLKSCPDAELVVLGRGNDLPRLKERVERENLGNVHFEGFVSDARKWEVLRASRVFAFPSTQEGFGLAAIEAASVGTPVVALENTAVAEVFGPSSGAMYAESASPGAIARALLTLLGDAAAAEKMGARGRERVAERFLDEQFKQRVLTALALA